MNKDEIQNIICSEGYIKLWKHKGLYCLILRLPDLLILNGYVGVTKENKLYGVHYDNVGFNVHGGLTFSDIWEWFQLEDVWWFGFDTAHGGDLIPQRITDPIFAKIYSNSNMQRIYRDMEYVTKEVNSLAKQIKETKQ